MAYYGINELTQSGATASLVQAGGFARSTVFGTSSAHTHQFSGSVYISGNLRAWTYKVDEVVSGSTIFGNDASDTHQFTGSVFQSSSVGTLTIGPDAYGSGSFAYQQTGNGTASFNVGGASLSVGDTGYSSTIDASADFVDISADIYASVSTFWLSDGVGTVQVNGGGTSVAGAQAVYANINFEVHYTGSKNPVNLAADTGGGEVVYFGITATTTTQGHLHYLSDSGKWQLTNANATGSTGETGAGNAGLLAIALGTDPEADGMLTRGYYNLPAAFGVMLSAWVTGSAVYVYSGSTVDSGKYTCVAPSGSDSYTRIIGYCTTQPQVVYFNPDSSWVEIS